MGFPVDGSERLPMSRVMEEEAEVDRTSMSSSLQHEDDILLPSGLCWLWLELHNWVTGSDSDLLKKCDHSSVIKFGVNEGYFFILEDCVKLTWIVKVKNRLFSL